MQGIIFREFEDKDASVVSQFLQKIFTEMGWTPRPEDYIDDVKGGFYDKNGFFLVGELGTTLVATAGLIQLTPTTMVLKRFYVDPLYRGQGVAQLLLQYVFENLHKMGYKTVFLDVDRKNTRAIRFYEKEGFEKCTVESNPLWWESCHQAGHFFYNKNV